MLKESELSAKSEIFIKLEAGYNNKLIIKSETEFHPSTIIRKFFCIKMLSLKKTRLDNKNKDIFYLKYICALMVYIIKLKNKIKSVYYIKNRILISKIYQKIINDSVFIEK